MPLPASSTLNAARSTKLLLLSASTVQESGKAIHQMRDYASDLERGGWNSAAGSLREGLEELFTINALGLPSALRRCLGTTNLLDAAHSGTRGKLRRVTTWRNGAMAARWVAAAMVETEKSFRKIQGHHQLWMLEANVKERCERKKAQAADGSGAADSPSVARAGAAA